MNSKEANALIKKWSDSCNTSIPLFKTEKAKPSHVTLDAQGLVRRSDELTKRLGEIKEAVKNPRSEADRPEGIFYFIYRYNENVIEPLYIGISETIGKKRRISSLFTGGWARFGEEPGSNGHIGNINQALRDEKDSYGHWAKALFKESSRIAQNNPSPELIKPVYVRVDLWEKTSKSIIEELGHAPLKLEEMLVLHLLQLAELSGTLLNRDGNRQLHIE